MYNRIMAGIERMTPQMLLLLEVLASDPNVEWWGLALAKAAGIRSPTIYRALARLETARWVTSSPEEIDPALEGRPRRRLYRLTPHGVREATRLLDDYKNEAPARATRTPPQELLRHKAATA
jgi:PadR family transcriptional regulator, regulatory protein PadR